MSQQPSSQQFLLKLFRAVGWIEGLSFLVLLLIAMPLKYFFGLPEATRLVGMAHGVLFLIYLLLAFQVATALNWPFRLLLKAFLAAVIPLGPFFFDRKYLR